MSSSLPTAKDITIRLHLPGLGRTEKYTIKHISSLDEGKGLNYGIQQSITNHFKLDRNRSCLLIFKDNDYQMLWALHDVKIEENDTLMLCTRNSTTEGADNTYYHTQQYVLMNNTCLEPPLSSDNANSILRHIDLSFRVLGYKASIHYDQSEAYRKRKEELDINYAISPRPKCSHGSAGGGKAVTRKKKNHKRISRRNKRKNSK